MPYFNGTHASVTIGGKEWSAKSWSLATSIEKIEISDFDQRTAKFMPGMISSTISLEGPYEYPLWGGFLLDGKVEVTLFLDFELDPNASFAATGIITDLTINTDISEIASIHLGITVISDFLVNDPWEF